MTAALAARDWHGLFIRHRAAWADARLVLFGHALVEKLVAPRKSITAHTWLVPDAAPAALDRLAADWTAADVMRRRFLPLQVLGVPGWWPANEAPAYYDDPAVFRPPPPQ